MNRIVIITGSSRGIGLATAAECLKSGDTVVIFCRHEEHVRDAVGYLARFGDADRIISAIGDVRKSEDVKRIVEETIERFGRIDVLVNNAGIALWKNVDDTTEAEWDDVLNTNLKGYFLFMRETVPIMKRQKGGVIVNVSSGLGVEGDEKYSAYCASKFGIVGLTQVVAKETHKDGVKVYAVLPGAVATKLHMDIHPWEDPNKMMTPEYVGEKIFALMDGKRKSGSSIEVRQ